MLWARSCSRWAKTVFVLVLTVYMLIKREDLHNRLLLLAGMGRLNLVTKALDDAGKRITSFLTMNFLVNAGYGLCFGIGLFVIGIPNATLWGVIASVLRFVPYIGTSIGVLLPFVFALGVYQPWGPALVVLALFAVLEFSVSNILEPWLYGSHTGISTLALLIMAVFWTLLWGWPGLVLSTPLTVCLIVMGLHMPQLSFLHILLGDQAQLAPEAKFYERLLAMDQAEAHVIAEGFLSNHSMAELYDVVLLPALSLAERDRHQGALDEVRANFVFQCANELLAELADTAVLAPDSSPPNSGYGAQVFPSHLRFHPGPGRRDRRNHACPASRTVRQSHLAAPIERIVRRNSLPARRRNGDGHLRLLAASFRLCRDARPLPEDAAAAAAESDVGGIVGPCPGRRAHPRTAQHLPPRPGGHQSGRMRCSGPRMAGADERTELASRYQR